MRTSTQDRHRTVAIDVDGVMVGRSTPSKMLEAIG
jgi:hypothetical protein